MLGTSIAYRVWKNRLYLTDFESDLKNISIRYFNGKTEHTEYTQLENIKVELKNTSSRSGFNCELRLTINHKKFVIEDTFDWSLSEMKNLFEYIKKSKSEPLTDKDEFNLSRIEEKINTPN